MTKKEYIKYHQEMKDYRGKTIILGATVVFNNYYDASINIGIVDHFTENGKVAIVRRFKLTKGGSTYICYSYREPNTIVIIKNGNRNKIKYKTKSKS